MARRLWSVAAFLAILAILGKFYAKPVLAEVRAALTQNIDEPGRNRFALLQGGTTEGVFTVPATQRYVLESVSFDCYIPASSTLLDVSLGGTTAGTNVLVSTTGGHVYDYGASLNAVRGTFAVRTYLDPGTEFVIDEHTYGAKGTCDFYVSGYAINNP